MLQKVPSMVNKTLIVPTAHFVSMEGLQNVELVFVFPVHSILIYTILIVWKSPLSFSHDKKITGSYE